MARATMHVVDGPFSRTSPQFDSVARLPTFSGVRRTRPQKLWTPALAFIHERFSEQNLNVYSWWCPSVNSFKFQPCDHTPPGTQRLMISHKLPGESSMRTSPDRWSAWFMVKTTTVSDRLRSPNFRS